MLLCKKIKIEVSPRDVEALEFMQAKCRGLYNWLVMRLKSGERWNLEYAKKSLQESKQYDPELRYVYRDLYSFVQMLAYMCLHIGKELHIICERDTIRTYHVCKHKKDMPLWVCTYRCENCGLVMNYDYNNAVNIYDRFLAEPLPHTL